MVPASNLAELNQAFDQIAQVVASCEYVLDQAPPGLDLFVYFNDDPAGIPRDPTNGWSYDPVTKKLTFHGAACDRHQERSSRRHRHRLRLPCAGADVDIGNA